MLQVAMIYKIDYKIVYLL